MTAALGSAGGIAAVAERFLSAVVTRGDLESIGTLFHEDHVLHAAPAGGVLEGRDGIHELVTFQRRVFRDLVMRIDALVVAGDHVVARGFLGGTNAMPMHGLPATGLSVMSPAVYWFRFEGALIRETWVVIDRLDGALQMGMVRPATDAAPDPGWT